jgi:molybdenum cofactor synthesis domain-containing protein
MEHRGFVFHEQNLLPPDVAVATFLARTKLAPLGSERVTLEDAYGRVLAQRAVADGDYPDAPRSAMDGFAVSAASTPGRLRVVGEISMGRVWVPALIAGTAVRIPTGGVVPDGADAVVPIEDATLDGDVVGTGDTFNPGDNLTPRASDMHAGDSVLEAGTWIGGPQLGVLATLGATEVCVYRRPVFAVISSGDELVEPGTKPGPGQIRDSNRYAVAGALQGMGASARQWPTVPDVPGALEAALRTALAQCDGVIVSGGSSVGERDHTPSAITALGEPGVIVHGLRVKPGKPTVLGAAGSKPVIGLPGNPSSALIILEAVLSPVIAAMVGCARAAGSVEARLAYPVRSRAGWTWYLPVRLQHEGGSWMAHPLPLRSSAVSLTAKADGFIAMPEAAEFWDAGMNVTVTRFL